MSKVVRTRLRGRISQSALLWLHMLKVLDRIDEIEAVGKWKYVPKAHRHRTCVECNGQLMKDESFICKACLIRLKIGGGTQ